MGPASSTKCAPPNSSLQPMASSVRSCLAHASSRARCPALESMYVSMASGPFTRFYFSKDTPQCL
jgi:hypothetical protein